MNCLTFVRLPARCHLALLAVFLALPWRPLSLAAQTPVAGAVPGIKLSVKEGEGAINNIRTLRAKEPVVLVTDMTGKPIPGAQVTFLVPDLGASGLFAASGATLTVTTGPDGLATGRGLKPNNVVGQFQIRVVASFVGQTARATINQTNAAPARSGGNGGRTALILALVGGAGAAVAVGVTRGGNKNPTGPTTASTSISAGGSSFGPPQ